MSLGSSSGGLGSLAQSSRSKQLKQARGVLIAIGVLTIGVNAFFAFSMRSQVKTALEAEVQKAQGQGMVVDRGKLQQVEESAVRFGYMLAAVFIALGVVFVVFGLIVQKYPVPITVTSLVLYVGAVAVTGWLDSTTLLQG